MPRVLLIDDEEGFTNLLRASLQLGGRHEVEVVNDPSRALETALNFDPEVIVCDLIMPEMDGGDVVARFKNSPSLAQVPFILLTALVSPDEVGAGSVAQSGDHPVLPKPVDLEVLNQCIEECLETAS